MDKIAFGGSCHWCTEAIFQSLQGVVKVEQGFVSSTGIHHTFSEAVIVHFDSSSINLTDLIEIHLHTHRSASNHALRLKYRSAVYFFSEEQKLESLKILKNLEQKFTEPLITEILPFRAFKSSKIQFIDYYYKNPERPFCRTYIRPKLNLLLDKFNDKIDNHRIKRDAIY